MRYELAAVAAFALSFAAVPVSADEYPPCEPFVVWAGDFEITGVDLGEKGMSIGDERLGERELLDGDGNDVGILRWVSIVVDIEEGKPDSEVALNQLIYALPDGAIHATGEVHYADILAKGTQPSARNSLAVTGGTGVYVHSGGEITFEPGNPSKVDFNLSCD